MPDLQRELEGFKMKLILLLLICILISCTNKEASCKKCTSKNINKSIVVSIRDFSSLESIELWEEEFNKISTIEEKKNRISDLKFNYNSRLESLDKALKDLTRVGKFKDEESNLWAEYFYWKYKNTLIRLDSEVVRNR